MEIQVVYRDERTVVKQCNMDNKMLWTSTYIKDEDGNVEKHITVYPDGEVEIHEYQGIEPNVKIIK